MASVWILGPHVGYRRQARSLVIDTPQWRLSIADAPAALDLGLASLENGMAAVDSGLPRLLQQRLQQCDALHSLPARPEGVDGFLDGFLALCDSWALGVFASPFWPRFMAGQATAGEVFGFLGQLYHRTAGADLHNRCACENCQLPALRPHLLRHYQEEQGHAAMIADGLRRCGAPGCQAVDTPALASTRRLIALMVSLSRWPAAYLGCYGIFHAPATIRDAAALRRQFAGFAQLYPFAAPGFDAVCRHAQLDYRLGHEEIMLARWLREQGPPDGEFVLGALRGARCAAAAFRAIFDELFTLRPQAAS
ncbi:hypothetical protein [Chromobacterium sphagni]|uniref:Thiaminase-2/PQQC domain-containing protein n=1 Tax=Chromobacterium sphagni TaxID=1903179 RepID=A0ABX3C7H2_9NEIS|nr:hypothetical protein [Chromobacterium sphagni]OHX16307.1 hypothetical protein BI344_12880 [Chromobacterium sphagni]